MIYYDLEEVLEKEPGFGPAHFRLAWIFWMQLGYIDKAEEHFRLALKFSPEYPWTYYHYAFMLNEINHSQKLKSVAEKGMKVKGVNRFFLHNILGKSHEKNSRYEEAHDFYQMALRHAFISYQADEVKISLKRVKEKLKLFETSIEETLSDAQK